MLLHVYVLAWFSLHFESTTEFFKVVLVIQDQACIYQYLLTTFSQQHLIPVISNGPFPPPHRLTIYHSNTQPDQKPVHTANKQAQNLKQNMQ